MAVYVESSALVAWLLDEETADRVQAVFDSDETLVSSVLTTAETQRVLVCSESTRRIDEASGRRHRAAIRAASEGLVQMEITGSVLERSSRSFPVEPIRTLDAIHLATALEFLDAFPDLRVLTFDRRVQENAEALGLDLV